MSELGVSSIFFKTLFSLIDQKTELDAKFFYSLILQHHVCLFPHKPLMSHSLVCSLAICSQVWMQMSIFTFELICCLLPGPARQVEAAGLRDVLLSSPGDHGYLSSSPLLREWLSPYLGVSQALVFPSPWPSILCHHSIFNNLEIEKKRIEKP